MMGGFGGMMGGYQGMMGGLGMPLGFMGGLSLVEHSPCRTYVLGAIILIFFILSLLGLGGFFIGAILGIIGGALALSWKPRPGA